jgi:hypothetical protein
MKCMNTSIRNLIAMCALVSLVVISCSKDDKDVLPITNDFRLLQINLDGDRVSSGAIDISVIPQFEFVFSHGIDTNVFKAALIVSPAADYILSYDPSMSFVTFSFITPLQYNTPYRIDLPAGSYGVGGQSSKEDIVFDFTTANFEPPAVTLTKSVNKFFEGDTARVIATLNRAILEDVSMDLVFSGTAIGSGTDYTSSAMTINIPSGSVTGSVELISIKDGEPEGEERIIVTLANLVNVVEDEMQQIEIALGDAPPGLELRGVMELENYIGGTDGKVRAIHLKVLSDIDNLGDYGVEIASNGAEPNPADIDFVFPDLVSAAAGQNIFIVRDVDEANAQMYFGSCYSDFTVFTSDQITQNGDDAIILYNNGVAIESFGEPGIDGTGTYWEYTNSWAYKLNEEWIYAGVGCVESLGSETNATSPCKYPFCSALQLQGVSALLWDGSGTNGGKAVQVRANRDIADLSQYGLGVANNGGGTDGIEFTFPAMQVKEGDHILVAREPGTIASYFGSCYNLYDHVFQDDAMTQNGDDAIELFDGDVVIETYGDANVDGTGQPWEYAGSWAFKIGKWNYGGVDCAAGSTTTQASSCPYLFCQ